MEMINARRHAASTALNCLAIRKTLAPWPIEASSTMTWVSSAGRPSSLASPEDDQRQDQQLGNDDGQADLPSSLQVVFRQAHAERDEGQRHAGLAEHFQRAYRACPAGWPSQPEGAAGQDGEDDRIAQHALQRVAETLNDRLPWRCHSTDRLTRVHRISALNNSTRATDGMALGRRAKPWPAAGRA